MTALQKFSLDFSLTAITYSDPILSQFSPVHIITAFSSDICNNIVCSYSAHSRGFPVRILYTFLIFQIQATCSTHQNLLDLTT
jgi:hypothetical protein